MLFFMFPSFYQDESENNQQAEAEVVPSSSLVELEVQVGVWVGFEVGVEAWVKMQCSFLTFFGQVGGWEEKWRLWLPQTKVIA